MKITTLRLAVAATLVSMTGFSAPVAAQQTPQQRAQATLPVEVYEEVSAVAREMAASGVPAGPLFNKALEGAAKRVPPAQLVPAVRAYGGRLQQARTALGPTAGVPLLVAGAVDSLKDGLTRAAQAVVSGAAQGTLSDLVQLSNS